MIVFGSSGHAQEISFFLKRNNQKDVSCYIAEELGTVNGATVIDESQLEKVLRSAQETVVAAVAIGSGSIRKKVVDKFSAYDNLIFPSFFLGDEFETIGMGQGNIFFPTFYATVNVLVGSHNHFNLKTSISHDVIIGDYNTFSPNVTVAGRVRIGNNVFLGAGATIVDNVSICNDVIIGAGAVVIGDIEISGTYVGVPAKKIK